MVSKSTKAARGKAPATAKSKKAAPAAAREPDGCTAGFYCYIGPSIAGVIRNGAVYKGTREDALAAAAAAIKKQPLVKSLIVSGNDLPEARLQVKKPGNALHTMYSRITGKK